MTEHLNPAYEVEDEDYQRIKKPQLIIYMKAGTLIFDLCVPSLPSLEFGGINPAFSMASQTSLPGLASSFSAFKLLSR